MIIDIISDLHGYYPKLEGGDVLIVAGDLTKSNKQWQYLEFRNWLRVQDYKHIILVCGNHDGCIEDGLFYFSDDWMGCTYLRDEEVIIEGLKFYGSPWTAQFPKINPDCCAFTVKYHDHTDEILEECWKKIPDDTDILITHCPPYGIFDGIKKIKYSGRSNTIEHVGSQSLKKHVKDRIKPKLHVFGHIHEHGGLTLETESTTFVNASHVNEHYEPVNNPVRIVLCGKN